jgi:hypothetical protein
MNYIRIIYFIFLIMLISNCDDKKIGEFDFINNDQEEIKELIVKYKTTKQIDSLMDFGLYNLAFEAVLMNDNIFSDQDKIMIANQFVDNGEFDKGLALSKTIHQKNNYYDIICLKLNCALNKQDNMLSGLLLDSLKITLQENTNSEKQVAYNMLKGYHAHNTKQYYLSIAINEQVLNDVKLFHLPTKYLLKAYRRLGNDYNDIVRDKIPFNKNAAYCFKKGIYYYQKELELLLQSANPNHTKIALNYFTTAMLVSSFDKKHDVLPYYKKALNSLIVNNTDGFYSYS